MNSKELWRETAGVKRRRNLGTARVNIIETGDDEGSMTDIAKEAAIVRVQALKS
jgi:hypothetical protein